MDELSHNWQLEEMWENNFISTSPLSHLIMYMITIQQQHANNSISSSNRHMPEVSVFTSSDKGIHSPTEAPESPTIKSKHSRSRGGCARCKRRRQKCDEQKPSCSRCKIEGIRECTYTMTLQWGGREFGHFKSYARNSDIKKCGEL